ATHATAPVVPLHTRISAGVDGVHVDRPALEGGPSAEAAVFAVRPDQVVADHPGGIGAELVPPREVELVDGEDQREVADADQLGELVGATAVSPGDRDDQAEVG